MDLDLDDATGIPRRGRARSAPTSRRRRCPRWTRAAGFELHRAWEHTLADARLSVVSWPAEFGGRDASLLQWVVFEEEYFAAGAPLRVSQNGIFLLAPTLFAHGTPEQLARLLPPMARADEIWAQAWSEPEAGSDLAAIRTRAVRTDGGWLLSGQKTWSTRATFADRASACSAATPTPSATAASPTSCSTCTPTGVTVRGIQQLDGETGFAEIFLDDVFVPDADVLGGVGDGWRVAMSTASNERGLSLRSPGRFWPPRTGSSTCGATRPTPPTRACGAGRRRLDRCPRLPVAHLRDRHPAGRGRRTRRGVQHRQAVLVATRRRPARDRAGPAGAARRLAGASGWTGTCSPWPARSTPAPTRSSASIVAERLLGMPR